MLVFQPFIMLLACLSVGPSVLCLSACLILFVCRSILELLNLPQLLLVQHHQPPSSSSPSTPHYSRMRLKPGLELKYSQTGCTNSWYYHINSFHQEKLLKKNQKRKNSQKEKILAREKQTTDLKSAPNQPPQMDHHQQPAPLPNAIIIIIGARH